MFSTFLFTIYLTLVHVSSQSQIVVSNEHSKDDSGCGVHKALPCATLRYAITQRVSDSGVNVILLDNRHDKMSVYPVNQTILIKASIILTSQYKNLTNPIITSYNEDLALFQFIESKMYNLLISNISFHDSSVVTFSSRGSITFRNCSFINLVKFLFCENPAVIIINIDGCNFIGSNKRMASALIHTSSYCNLNLLVQYSIFDRSGHWIISNAAQINSSLDIKIYHSKLTDASNNERNKPDISICIDQQYTHGSVDIKNSNFIKKSIEMVNINRISLHDAIFDSDDTLPPLRIDNHNSFDEMSSFTIKDSYFTNSLTGAIAIHSCIQGFIIGCRFENNTQSHYYRVGGAISNYNCSLWIEGCMFDNNSALSSGGTISSNSKYDILSIKNTQIIGPRDTPSLLGTIIYCLTGVSLNNVHIDASLSVQSTNPFLIIGDLEMLAYNENFTFNCPFSSDILVYKTMSSSLYLSFYCKPCPEGSYSLFQGKALYHATDRLTDIKTSHIKCLLCPTSGICNGGLICKDNFWGYKSYPQETLLFRRCPPYYCCSSYGKHCTSINTCEENRSGKLCGRCKNGYSESYIGNKCVPNASCNKSWFWLLYLLVVIMSVFGILYLNDTFTLVKNIFQKPLPKPPVEQPLLSDDVDVGVINGFDNNENSQLGLSDGESIITESNKINKGNNSSDFSGLIKILFFFYQAEGLLRVRTSAKKQYHLPLVLHDMLSSIFNFQIDINQQRYTICPVVGLTAVWKEFIKVSIVVATFTMFLILYFLQKIYKRFRRGEPRAGPGFQKSFCIRIKYGFIQLALLGFSILAVFSFKTTHCVLINGDNHLYIQGDVRCFQSWQKVIFSFLALWVIPFPVALYFGSYFLQSFKLSANAFFRCLIFPPLGMFYYMRALLVETNLSDQQQEVSKYFLQVIYGPYRKRKHNVNKTTNQVNLENDFLLWESVLILRRLAMTIVFIVTLNPVIRLYILLLMLVVFWLSHYKFQPFENQRLNDLETLSLSILCCLSAINIFWAYTEEFDLLHNPDLYVTGYVFLILELITLSLPVFVCSIFVLFSCLKWCVKKIIKKCISKHD